MRCVIYKKIKQEFLLNCLEEFWLNLKKKKKEINLCIRRVKSKLKVVSSLLDHPNE